MIRSLESAKSTSPVNALAAQRVVSCEYLLIPSISLVDGSWASGEERSWSLSDGWNGLEEESRSRPSS